MDFALPSYQLIKQLVRGAVRDVFWGDLDLLLKRGKETRPAQMLVQGTQAGASGRHRAKRCHSKLLVGWQRTTPAQLQIV